MILLDPYYGPFKSFLLKRLSPTEGFDKNFSSWETAVIGPMNGANQVLSYIIFVRDRNKFEKKYPRLKVVYQKTLGHYLKYILFSGLSFRPLLPTKISHLVDFSQWCPLPFKFWHRLHHNIVIRKKY